jgi:hypothetical protein
VLLTPHGGYAFAGVTDTYHYDRQHTEKAGLNFWLVRTGPDPIGNGVTLLDPAFPSQFAFSAPYPNPFNTSTNLTYSVPHAVNIDLSIFDFQGRRVATLANGWQEFGQHSIIWNASLMPAGTYLICLKAKGFNRTVKLILGK